MVRESFINKRTLSESSDDAFVERTQKDATELAEFFEEKGAGIPVREVLEEGFHIVPIEDLIHSVYWSADRNAPAKIELSRVGQMPGIFGSHTRMHEMGHAFSKHQDLEKVTEILFPDGTRKPGLTRVGTKVGFHFRLQRRDEQHELHLFSALNEALTDTIPIEILKTRDWGKIYQHFLFVYPRERNMLATIVSSMGKSGGEGNAFKLFVESNLTGWTPELKQKLLDTFGPNALRVLAIVNSPTYVKDQDDAVTLYRNKWWQFWTKHFYNEALTYFDIDKSVEERDAAARKMLPAEGALHFVEREQKKLTSTGQNS